MKIIMSPVIFPAAMTKESNKNTLGRVSFASEVDRSQQEGLVGACHTSSVVKPRVMRAHDHPVFSFSDNLGIVILPSGEAFLFQLKSLIGNPTSSFLCGSRAQDDISYHKCITHDSMCCMLFYCRGNSNCLGN